MNCCGKFENWGEQSLYERYLVVRDFIVAGYWSVMLLGMRVWVGMEFYKSGQTRFENWDLTLYLFENEHPVPYLPVEFVAKMASYSEIILPIFLFAGLFTRLATLPLLAMAIVIQFVLGEGVFNAAGGNPMFDKLDHFVWMAMFIIIFTKGAGKISVDYFLQQGFKCKFSSKE